MSDEPTGPAWGYRKGEAKIFDDGILPKGWVDSPAKVKGAAVEDAPEVPAEQSEAGE